jgi:hypothetical protein
MTSHRSFMLDDLLSSSWDRKIVLDVVDELASLSGETYCALDEVRRFLQLQSYRELLHRLKEAREGHHSYAALRSVAQAIRQFGIERPALFTAAFRSKPQQAAECREACHQILVQVFAECGAHGQAADEAILVFLSLIRGLVLAELLSNFACSRPYEETYETAIALFIAGLPSLLP